MPKQYDKPFCSVEQQIQLLKDRGMAFTDETQAQHALLTCNYYRLSGYWIFFEDPDGVKDQLKPGTRFEDVLNLYHFDEALRHLLSSRLEKLETAVKTSFAYHLSRTHTDGALAYLDPSLFSREKNASKEEKLKHEEALKDLNKAFQKSKENFAKELREKYSHPPIWAVTEVMSFGQIAFWLSNLQSPEPLTSIAQGYHFNPPWVFCKFIQAAADLRNICAHHGRLTHRTLTTHLPDPGHSEQMRASWRPGEKSRTYNLLTALEYVMHYIQPDSGMGPELKKLSEKHSVNLSVLGFPENWEELPVWSGA